MVNSKGGIGARLTAWQILDPPRSELRLLVAVTQTPSAPVTTCEDLI